MRYQTSISRLLMLGGLLLLGVLLPACSILEESGIMPQPTEIPAPIIPTPVDTPEPSDPEASEELAADGGDVLQNLIVWTNPEISPALANSAGSTLATQIQSFVANHPNVEIRIEDKAPQGPGGIVSYLRTGRNVAPSVMPDLVLMPSNQLPELVQENLVFPLNDLIPAEARADLYPVAETMGSVSETLYGFPYAIDGMTHSVYVPEVLTTTLPLAWQPLTQTPIQMLFPAASSNGRQLLLQFYLAEGGTLRDESGSLRLEEEALTNALAHLRTGQTLETVLASSGSSGSQGEIWLSFQNGRATLIQSTAREFLNQRAAGSTAAFAPLPGPNGPLTPQLTGHVWIITTPDPARQALAVEMLVWLANGPNMGDWTAQSNYLPARRTAFDRWPQDEYTAMLQQEMERAIVMPQAIQGTGPISSSLDEALQLLFTRQDLTPQDIAQEAIRTTP